MNHKVNEIKISYRERVAIQSMPRICCASDAAKFLFKHWDKDSIGFQESFKVLLLNNTNRLKGIYEISKGSITGTVVDLRILFAIVLKSLTVSIVLAHNHPSGNLMASGADIELTAKIKNAADFLDIKILDHIIIAPDGGYYSFADNGLI